MGHKKSNQKGLDFNKEKTCPQNHAIIKVFLGDTPNQKKFEILNHVFSCPHCLPDFIQLKEVWRQSKGYLNELEGIELDHKKEKQLQAFARDEIRKLRFRLFQKTGSLSRIKPIPAAAVVVILIVGISSLFFLRESRETEIERGFKPWEIRLIEPQESVNETPLIFEWAPVNGALHYSLEILDNGLDIVYQADKIKEAQFKIPSTMVDLFVKGKVYFWKIIVTTESGQKVESEFGKFRIFEK